ncbi:hypothetical protein Avbf_12882 [Armadillidium vulgare]|nr:hypothetical protein Avbf_12882 [Armadillidium vulgare]
MSFIRFYKSVERFHTKWIGRKNVISRDPISEPSYPSYFTGNSENKNTDIEMAILRKIKTETIDFTIKK